MTRSIGAVSHGILDYLFVIILVIAPSMVGFATGRQARWCYIFAAVLFALAVLTQTRLLRLAIHGALELALAVLIVVLPWLLGFERGVLSRNFFFAIGLLLILLWALTDFRGRRGASSADRAALPKGGGP
jgi:uncharacterized membrane protein YfhO